MKTYTITVNGNVYNVTVEEGAGSGMAFSAPASVQSAPAAAPAAAAAPKTSGGSINIESAVAGKIFKIEASAGQSVNKGDTVLILESMKMEIPVVAPSDGTIAGFNVSVGDSVEAGDILATMD